MAYEPIPFVAPLIDQTSQRLKLADLLYQANMARSQAELQRQMQVAQMIAQFGQNIGAGIESWMDRQQRERALAIQAERENRLASAQEAQNQLMMDRMAAEDRRNAQVLAENLYDKMAGGTTFYGDQMPAMRERLGPYADLMQTSPELTATRQEITPAQTMQIGPSAMPAQPDVLESRPMNLAVLAGTAEPVQTTYEASMTKPFSAAETRAMEEEARREAERQAAIAETQRKNQAVTDIWSSLQSAKNDEQRRQIIDKALVNRVIDSATANAFYKRFEEKPAPTPQKRTMADEEREDFLLWKQANPGMGLADYRAEMKRKERNAVGPEQKTGTTIPIAAVERLQNMRSSSSMLDELEKRIAEAKKSGKYPTGPLASLKGWIPIPGIGTQEKVTQAEIDLVRQLIGKTLEGGKLMKEDEIKYEKMLPRLGDSAEVFQGKLKLIQEDIERNYKQTVGMFNLAGYNTENLPPSIGQQPAKKRMTLSEAAAKLGK